MSLFGVIRDAITGITANVDSKGALEVAVQDQTTRSLDLYFGNLGTLTTLSAQADPEDMTLTLTSTTGFVDGTVVGVFSADDPDIFYLGKQLGCGWYGCWCILSR